MECYILLWICSYCDMKFVGRSLQNIKDTKVKSLAEDERWLSIICSFRVIKWLQEFITRSLQLPHIPATAFSQSHLLLVWIYLSRIQISTGASGTNCNHKQGRTNVNMPTWGHIVLSLPKRAHVDWKWPISRVSKNYLKMALHWISMGVAGS